TRIDMIAMTRPALLPRRAGSTSSSASSSEAVLTLPANTAESVGSTRGRPENALPANAGSFGIAPRRPPIGPDVPLSSPSIDLISSAAHVAVARLPSGTLGAGFGGGGGCVGGRRGTTGGAGAGGAGVGCGGREVGTGGVGCATRGGGTGGVGCATRAGACCCDARNCGGGGTAASVAFI